jgi:hypothetical protein
MPCWLLSIAAHRRAFLAGSTVVLNAFGAYSKSSRLSASFKVDAS